MNRRHLLALLGGAAVAPMLPSAQAEGYWARMVRLGNQPMAHVSEIAEWDLAPIKAVVDPAMSYSWSTLRGFFPEPSE